MNVLDSSNIEYKGASEEPLLRDEVHEAVSFPTKLHAMLDDAEKLGFDDVVTWQNGGKSFKVMDPIRFSTAIMRNYFNQTKYKSFQRQLNMYGFRRIHYGTNKGGYAHRCFMQGAPEFCKLVLRRSAHRSRVVCQETQQLDDFFCSTSSLCIGDVDMDLLCDIFRPDESEEKLLNLLSSNDDAEAKDTRFPIQNPDIPKSSDTSGMGELFSILGNETDICDEKDVERLFPWKLHNMLEDAERQNFQHIVSWVQEGGAFKVHKSDEFVQEVMPNYFDQTKYESFRRQLNLYGFTRVSRGQLRGIYSHSFFVQSDKSMCRDISRRPTKIS